MNATTKNIRTLQWLQTIQACNTSGMRKEDWCKANGICPKTFYNWQRRLRDQMVGNGQMALTSEIPQPAVPPQAGTAGMPALHGEKSDAESRL